MKYLGFIRTTVYLFLLAIGISGVCLGQQRGPFTFNRVIQPGKPSPDGGSYFPCKECEGGVNGSRAFNSRGDVGIEADTVSPCIEGRFLISGTNDVWLAGFCPQAPDGKFNLLGQVNLNERGDAATLGGPIDSENFIIPTILVFSSGSNQFRIAAQSGDPTSGGTTDIGSLSKKCIFGEPFINNSGDVSFWGCTVDSNGMQHFGIFSASGGKITVVASDFDPSPSPIPGTFAFGFLPSMDAINNDSGQILFQAGVSPQDLSGQQFGLFVFSGGNIQKIVSTGDSFANGYTARQLWLPVGMLNNNGDVAFCAALDNASADSGIFLSSQGQIRKVITQGDASPIGGTFATFLDASLDDMVLSGIQRPEINSSDQVVFKAKAGANGKTPGIFMGSPTAIVKVVAVGDILPNGEKIGEIDTYSLNEAGQVAFFAYRKKGKIGPLGVWVASPVTPSINGAKLRIKSGVTTLVIKGSGFITNDSVIQVNGKQVSNMIYPADFQQNGGTITRLISTDPMLDELIPTGTTVQVTVVNKLTGLISGSFNLTR